MNWWSPATERGGRLVWLPRGSVSWWGEGLSPRSSAGIKYGEVPRQYDAGADFLIRNFCGTADCISLGLLKGCVLIQYQHPICAVWQKKAIIPPADNDHEAILFLCFPWQPFLAEKEILPGGRVKVCCRCYTKFCHPSDSVTWLGISATLPPQMWCFYRTLSHIGFW